VLLTGTTNQWFKVIISDLTFLSGCGVLRLLFVSRALAALRYCVAIFAHAAISQLGSYPSKRVVCAGAMKRDIGSHKAKTRGGFFAQARPGCLHQLDRP
jgi:hypothetical protein